MHIKIRGGQVKINRNRVGPVKSRIGGKLSVKEECGTSCSIHEPSNLEKLKSSLRAISISAPKPKYISF